MPNSPVTTDSFTSTSRDLAQLATTYRRHIRALHAALERTGRPRPDGRTLRRFADLLGEPLVDTLRGTALPPELAPPDWPLPQLWTAIESVQQRYLPPTLGYLRELLGASTR